MPKKLFLLLLIIQRNLIATQNSVRQNFNMDLDWKFTLGEITGAEKIGFNDKNWRTLNLPYDWSVEQVVEENEPSGGRGGYFPTGIGWYRKTLTMPPSGPGFGMKLLIKDE